MSRNFRVELKENSEIYVQIDGEGYKLRGPFVIDISHHSQVLTQINQNITESAKFQSKVIKVLNWGVEKGEISKQQRDLLLDKFSKIV